MARPRPSSEPSPETCHRPGLWRLSQAESSDPERPEALRPGLSACFTSDFSGAAEAAEGFKMPKKGDTLAELSRFIAESLSMTGTSSQSSTRGLQYAPCKGVPGLLRAMEVFSYPSHLLAPAIKSFQ